MSVCVYQSGVLPFAMDTLPIDVVLNVASFECAYELSLLSKTFQSTITNNMQTPVINRTDDADFFDLDEGVPYIDIEAVYDNGTKDRAEDIVRQTIMETVQMDSYSETSIEYGIEEMWNRGKGTVSEMVSFALRAIENEDSVDRVAYEE